MKRDRSIDGIHDWSGGYWVSYEKIMDLCEDLTRAAPTTTTTTLTRTVQEIADGCLSPWDGNHNGFERLVRQHLNDPGSMEPHGTGNGNTTPWPWPWFLVRGHHDDRLGANHPPTVYGPGNGVTPAVCRSSDGSGAFAWHSVRPQPNRNYLRCVRCGQFTHT